MKWHPKSLYSYLGPADVYVVTICDLIQSGVRQASLWKPVGFISKSHGSDHSDKDLFLHDLGHLVGLYLLISVPVSSSVQSLGLSVCGWLFWLTKGGCYLQIIVICVKVCLVVIGWNLCPENHCINVPRLEKNSGWQLLDIKPMWKCLIDGLINVDQRVFVLGYTSFKCFSSKLIEAKWQLCVLRN